MTNVVTLKTITTLPLRSETVLQAAIDNEIQDVIVIGRGQDGNGYYASANADAGDMLWLMERFKLMLLGAE